MFRDRLSDLTTWRIDPYRKPLIIRGCRQTGKSWLIDKFGQSFEHYVAINFEKEKSLAQYFKGDIHVTTLLDKLSVYANQKIIPGKTLLFLDEIQACEEAIQSLRYFKEECPDLHLIAAGSLLDFALDKVGISVGRVQFMHLYPLSFGEFLTANGLELLREHLMRQMADPVLHNRLLEQLKNYMWLGGMPAVVDAWLNTKDPILSQRIQDELIEAYQIDFHKYAKQHEIPRVQKVFESIPTMLGHKFIYTKIDNDSRVEVIKNAFLLLEHAGIAYPCYHTSAQAQPLASGKNQKKFKAFYFDIGIAQRLLGLDIHQWLLNPLPLSNQGNMAEQLVAQELIAYSNYRKTAQIYYWHREAKNSNAEVDFIILKGGKLVPIEVKSSKKGSMKSLHMFLASSPNADYGLKISEGDFNQHENLQEIPLYGLEGWLGQAED